MIGSAIVATTLVSQATPSGTKVPPAGPKAAPADAPGPSLLTSLLPFLPILLLFYFMILRPQQRQEQNRKQMIGALKRTDKVLTSAGIYGTIVQIEPDSDKVVLRVDDEKNLRLTFSKGSIVRRLDASASDDAASASGQTKS